MSCMLGFRLNVSFSVLAHMWAAVIASVFIDFALHSYANEQMLRLLSLFCYKLFSFVLFYVLYNFNHL